MKYLSLMQWNEYDIYTPENDMQPALFYRVIFFAGRMYADAA